MMQQAETCPAACIPSLGIFVQNSSIPENQQKMRRSLLNKKELAFTMANNNFDNYTNS